MQDVRKKSIGNWSGLASLAMMSFFWFCMRWAPPVSNVYLRYVALPLAMIVALLLAIIAVIKASKWWALALVLPSLAVLGLLSTL
jgi:hypothetical protein